jgi:TfoX N-terminal domain
LWKKMPYDPKAEERIEKTVSPWNGVTKKKMFGGTGYLHSGNMFCGVYREFLILRIGEPAAEKAMAQDHVRPFDITGRPKKGWVMVDGPGFASAAALCTWLDGARGFAKTLPEK